MKYSEWPSSLIHHPISVSSGSPLLTLINELSSTDLSLLLLESVVLNMRVDVVTNRSLITLITHSLPSLIVLPSSPGLADEVTVSAVSLPTASATSTSSTLVTGVTGTYESSDTLFVLLSSLTLEGVGTYLLT